MLCVVGNWAIDMGKRLSHPLRIQCFNWNLPRCKPNDLTSGQLFLGNHAPYARRAYIQALCCFLQSYYVTILIIREIEDRQMVVVARRANPFVIPRVARSGLEPKPIQRGLNLFVW